MAGKTKLAIAITATVVCAAVFGAAAVAHNKQFSNSVSLVEATRLTPAIGTYGGRVNSGKPRCRRHREVQIWRADVNPEVRLLTAHTGPGGKFRRKGAALPDGAKVYALIETKVLLGNAAHNHTCPVDRSPVRTIPYP
jgi:hypothetical protein